MEEDFIKVLWIEDDPIITEEYPADAERFGLALHPFCCWDDAKDALEKDFSSWDAIILDAKCKHHRDSADNATKFLSEALSGLRFLYAKNNHTINWYILSAGSEEEINDSILDDRKAWDGDWKKLYYSKTTERDELFQRIYNHVKIRPKETQIKTVYFRDVFEAIRDAGLDERIEACMLNLLIPVVYPDSVSASDYNNRNKDVRIAIEYVFRGMIKMGLLPPSLGSNNNKEGAVNLSWACAFIAGRPVDRSQVEVAYNIFPKILSKNLRNIVDTVGTSVHSSSGENDFDIYSKGTGESPYLLKSYALQLCDVILWYREYIRTHNDPKENSMNWQDWFKKD